MLLIVANEQLNSWLIRWEFILSNSALLSLYASSCFACCQNASNCLQCDWSRVLFKEPLWSAPRWYGGAAHHYSYRTYAHPMYSSSAPASLFLVSSMQEHTCRKGLPLEQQWRAQTMQRMHAFLRILTCCCNSHTISTTSAMWGNQNCSVLEMFQQCMREVWRYYDYDLQVKILI